MIDQPPPDVWCHPSLAVGRSRIAGDGLTARAEIAAGEPVLRLGGRLVTTAELEALIAEQNPAGRYVDTVTVFEGRHLVLPPGTTVHFANHSCDPNLWHAGPYDVVARHGIDPGDEVTLDYGTSSGAPGFAMRCECHSPRCRGIVSSDDWRLPELQRRYEGHWTPALAARIERATSP